MDEKKTIRTRAKWDWNARFYDWMTGMMEGKKEKSWYEKVWNSVKGPRVLEVGVGTGRSFTYYRQDLNITAIDFSSGMLARARQRAKALGIKVDLRQMDVQKLEFPDSSFDTVVAMCTFCSVPDPVLGIREMRRVVKPNGKIILLEHMRHDNRIVGAIMDTINPIVRIMGPSINRRTLENIHKAGLEFEKAENLALGGIFKFIIARPAK